MGIFNEWQKREVEVMVIGDNGQVQQFKFMRIMLDYAQAIQEGYSDKQLNEEMDINSADVNNWSVAYPRFKEYLRLMAQQKAFAEQITKDLALTLLGQAALGKRELTNQQLSAIKIIMQANEMLTKGPKVKKEKVAVTNFTLEEKDGGK